MAKKTQGTQLYALDPDNNELLTVSCALSIDGIDSTIEQVETTCLEDLARQYIAGLATPGQASFEINADPTVEDHVRLHQLKTAGTSLVWAVGWSDGTEAPQVGTEEDLDLPATRSWISFTGFMTAYPFSFAQNSVVKSNISIQVSGDPVWVVKSA